MVQNGAAVHEWHVGSRYKLIRDIVLTTSHDRPFKAEGPRLRKGSLVLLLDVKQDTRSRATLDMALLRGGFLREAAGRSAAGTESLAAGLAAGCCSRSAAALVRRLLAALIPSLAQCCGAAWTCRAQKSRSLRAGRRCCS